MAADWCLFAPTDDEGATCIVTSLAARQIEIVDTWRAVGLWFGATTSWSLMCSSPTIARCRSHLMAAPRPAMRTIENRSRTPSYAIFGIASAPPAPASPIGARTSSRRRLPDRARSRQKVGGYPGPAVKVRKRPPRSPPSTSSVGSLRGRYRRPRWPADRRAAGGSAPHAAFAAGWRPARSNCFGMPARSSVYSDNPMSRIYRESASPAVIHAELGCERLDLGRVLMGLELGDPTL